MTGSITGSIVVIDAMPRELTLELLVRVSPPAGKFRCEYIGIFL